MTAVDSEIALMAGPAELPRRNGELVFEAPWESRAFGLAVALAEQGVYDWEEFRQELIAEIGSWEQGPGRDGATWSYYERWLAALERLLGRRGLVGAADVERRAGELAERAAHEHG